MMDGLRQAVADAAPRLEVREAVGRVYGELQGAIDARRPACAVSGRCCRFEEFGHRLYVTTIELAAFVAGFEGVAGRGRLVEAVRVWDGTGCPFQINRLCAAHGIRPFGCRMFFCDATATAWQEERYEQFHAELKRLHETLGVPYFYVEWRAGLEAVLLPELRDEAAGKSAPG